LAKVEIFKELPQRNFVLAVGILKSSDRMDWLVEKCSEVGVKQGDPLGSFFFACGAQKSVQDIIAKFPIGLDILGYLDDNNLIVKRSMAKDVYKHLVLNFKKIGLEINPDKTLIFGSPTSVQILKNERSILSQIPNTNMSSELISVLGVPYHGESVTNSQSFGI
jgi:hypothetical protein